MEWTLKKASDDLARGYPSPLSTFTTKGSITWMNAQESAWASKSAFRPDDRGQQYILRLNNTWTSGAVKIQMAEGWSADFFLYSEKPDFFSDNTRNAIEENAVIKTEIIYDESLSITLSGGDYFSIDIDEKHAGIFRFRLVKNGVEINIEDPENPNNEMYISMGNATYSEPYTPPAEYPHTMYDCDTQIAYTANNEQEHEQYATLGYVHDLSECVIKQCADGFTWNPQTQTCDPDSGGGGGGGGGGNGGGDEESNPIFGFLILGLVAFGLWWLFSKPDNVKSPQPTYTKSVPSSGASLDA